MTLRSLDDARAVVVADTIDTSHVIAQIGVTFPGVQLIAEPAIVRRLLTDAIAQLDAIEASR